MKMKKFYSLLLLLSIFLSLLSFNAFAKECSFSWFIKRNGKNQPKLTHEQEIILKYDAYFIDSRLSNEYDEKII